MEAPVQEQAAEQEQAPEQEQAAEQEQAEQEEHPACDGSHDDGTVVPWKPADQQGEREQEEHPARDGSHDDGGVVPWKPAPMIMATCKNRSLFLYPDPARFAGPTKYVAYDKPKLITTLVKRDATIQELVKSTG